MKCLAIIFDVDGTLAETEELHRTAFNLTFKKWCLNWYWDKGIYKDLRKVSGGVERLNRYQNLAESNKKDFDKDIIRLIHKDKTIVFDKLLASTKLVLRPGVARLIKIAKSKNIKVALATATSGANVNSLTKNIWKAPAKKIFNAVATGDEVTKNKPSPAVYKLVLKKLQMKPKHCIAIEDSLNGLKSAKSADLKTIITPSSYTKNDNFALADLVLPSLINFKL